MEEGNKQTAYTALDIMRYLDGAMTSKEMRQLEMAALDDPFLQDAIDGYRQQFEKGNKEKLLPYLETVLAAPSPEKKPARVVPFFKMGVFKYAVAAMLIAGTGWYIFSLTNPSQKLVYDTTPATPEYVSPVDSNINTEKNGNADNAIVQKQIDQPQASVNPAASAPAKNSDKAQQKSANIQRDVAANGTDDGANSKREMAAKVATDQHTTAAQNAPSIAITESKKEPVAVKPAQTLDHTRRATAGASEPVFEKQMLRNSFSYSKKMISGKTMDADKYPLENITVTVKGDSSSTVSDALGRYKIAIPDTGAVLVASGPGFKQKEFIAGGSAAKMDLELEPSYEANLQEVVVSGYARSKQSVSKAVKLDMDTSDAAPAGGWRNFTRYVRKNKQVKSNTGEVAVVLSFEIDENGRPGAMDIIESGGKAYDKEAMRLLMEGPNWINKTKDKVAFAKITIVL